MIPKLILWQIIMRVYVLQCSIPGKSYLCGIFICPETEKRGMSPNVAFFRVAPPSETDIILMDCIRFLLSAEFSLITDTTIK